MRESRCREPAVGLPLRPNQPYVRTPCRFKSCLVGHQPTGICALLSLLPDDNREEPLTTFVRTGELLRNHDQSAGSIERFGVSMRTSIPDSPGRSSETEYVRVVRPMSLSASNDRRTRASAPWGTP